MRPVEYAPLTYAVESPLPFAFIFYSDLTVSADGNEFAGVVGGPDAFGDIVGFYSSGMSLLNFSVYPLVSPPHDSQVLGATFSPAGKVIVTALGDSIEFWDTASGRLRARLMTPEKLHTYVSPEGPASPQIALDATGQTIFAISVSGLTVMKLPEPADDLPLQPWTMSRALSHKKGALGSVQSRMQAMRSVAMTTSESIAGAGRPNGQTQLTDQ